MREAKWEERGRWTRWSERCGVEGVDDKDKGCDEMIGERRGI